MIYILDSDNERIHKADYTGEASIVILTNPKGEVLLHLRDDIPTILYPAYWTVPGGMKEEGESSEETAMREVMEEIDFTVSSLKIFAQTIDTSGRNELISVYVGKIDKDISKLALNEGTDMQFFSFEKLHTLKIIPFVRKVLEKFWETQSVYKT